MIHNSPVHTRITDEEVVEVNTYTHAGGFNPGSPFTSTIYLPLVMRSPSLTRSIIEAENCAAENHCGLEGIWTHWREPGSSNGELIDNEESQGTPADSSKLFLTFSGTRVTIVYRRDWWYGTLNVKIDGKDGDIDQRGEPRNQVKADFSAVGEGPHCLLLSASKDRGVVTIDAIEILK